jgi:DNA-binding response OmpR family regulator
VVDDLPALAWGEAPPREVPSAAAEDPDDAHASMPTAVLIVGGESLAEALTEDASSVAHAFECERTEDAQTALELARAYAPDVMVVDADVARAPELVEALLDDPLTEPVPIVVVGSFRSADESARFVALGVAKALAKPVGPEALRRACDEILEAREGRTMRITLGEPTLEQLADRLAEELKRALVDSVDRPARSCRVPLGEGTEVLGALWGAIARVQEIVSQRTGGAVRFGGDAPEGAIALAPWLHQDVPAAERLGARGRGAAADVRLNGRRVVVADDDPGVTWFISDLLRTAGCEVHEALDGVTALELAFRVQPELVVSDILMPGMDGFALSRALRRDVALRDVPVILLSWKEDLLQRVRELGASAAAYMKKESDSRAILARVREVLRPRARIEMRLRGEGEVRGRLDDLTARLLLELVSVVRRDARVGVRDASYLYEIEIRGGDPRKITRTASDGGYLSGERALASLLGVGAGRFVVSPSNEPIRGELGGTLFEQLRRPLAAARGALAATTGARTVNVERIVLDEAALEDSLRATPDPAHALIKRLARGDSPRQMLLAGEVSPTLLEDVLADLAARGAIRAVQGANRTDLLAPAVEAALAVLRGAPRVGATLPPNARPSVPAAPPIVKPRATAAPAPEPARARSAAPPRHETLAWSAPPPPPPAPAGEPGGVPSSLEDAVMREISDRSPQPGAVRTPASDPPPIVEPSALRPRSSNPPAVEQAQDPAEAAPLPSIPPDAIVPAATSGEDAAAEVPVPRLPWEDPETAPPPVSALDDAPQAAPPGEMAAEPAEDTTVEEAPYSSPFAVATQPIEAAAPARLEHTVPLAASTSPATAPAPAPGVAPATPKRAAWPFLIAFAVLGLAVGAVLRLTGSQESRVSVAAPGPASAASASGASLPAPSTSASGAPQPSGPAPSASATGEDLPPGAEVPPGFGLVEVAAPAGVRVRIDGAIAGFGPSVSLVAAPGYHEVRIDQQDGGDAKQVVEVRPAKTTRVKSAQQP